METMKQRLIQAIKKHALEFGEFTLKSGAKSNFYLDIRKLSLSSDLFIIVRLMQEVLEDVQYEFDAIGGPCIGADPIVGGFLAHIPACRGFLVRKEEKDHGKAGLIIGSVRKGDHCVVVEDVTTTGGSLLKAIDAIEEFGGKVIMAVTVVDRLQGASEALAERKIPFRSLVTIEEVMQS